MIIGCYTIHKQLPNLEQLSALYTTWVMSAVVIAWACQLDWKLKCTLAPLML